MKMNLYSVRDIKAGYGNPYCMQNDEMAIRDIKLAVNSDKPNIIKQFPEDFELTRLGTFDTETGIIIRKVEMIINCRELKTLEKIVEENKNKVEHKPEINVF